MGYSGSGYAVDPTTGKALPVFTILDYINSRTGFGFTSSLQTDVSAALANLGAVDGNQVYHTFLAQYDKSTLLPQSIDAFAAGLAAAIPSGQLVGTVSNATAQIKAAIEGVMQSNLGLEGSGADPAAIASALQDPALAPNSPTFFTDVYDLSFTTYLKEFPYLSGNPLPSADTNFESSFIDYTAKIATIANTSGANLNFDQIYKGYFGSNNAAFTTFLANYISSIVYPKDGSAAQGFMPSEDIGAWLQKVQAAYSTSLYGSAAPTTSSVGNSFKKVVIIDQVLQLIIKMIGTLQKVASMQSDRLRILTLQQSAYTTLLTQVPVFTSGDGTIFGGKLASADEMQKARDQANNYNQTLSETVRSKRTTVQDDSKVLQSNINQSNDSANDQASTATALLQTLSTILGAIYR
jgi:hypothetical protein